MVSTESEPIMGFCLRAEPPARSRGRLGVREVFAPDAGHFLALSQPPESANFVVKSAFAKEKQKIRRTFGGMAPPGSAIKSVLSSQYPIDETEPQHRRRQISSDHFVSR